MQYEVIHGAARDVIVDGVYLEDRNADIHGDGFEAYYNTATGAYHAYEVTEDGYVLEPDPYALAANEARNWGA